MKGLKNKLALRRGLLGQQDYRSSDDSDYAPPEERAAAVAAAARKQAAAKRTTQQRKERSTRAPPPPAAAAAGASRPAVSSSTDDSSQPLSIRAAKRARAAAHQEDASSPSGWAHLPNGLLLQVFQEVCGKSALPMLPMLCLVCCDWRAAVAAAPELWRYLDLGQQRVRLRSKTKVQQMQQSLLRSLKSGRLQQCKDLRLGPEAWDAAAALSEEVDEACLPDLFTSKALALLPTACPHLTSFSLTGLPAPGRFSFTGQELATALLQLPNLIAVAISGQVFRAHQHSNHLLRDLLRGAAAGRLRLQRLVVEHNVEVSQNTLKELWCHSSTSGAAAADVQAASSAPATGQQGGAEVTAAAGRAAAVASAMSPAPYASLQELDLSYSCSSSLINIQQLQAATPQLRVLHWTGLGGFAGWRTAASASSAAAGEWPHLRVCHLGAAVRAGPTLTRHGISYVDDAYLTRLLQGSPALVDLDLSGTRVTPAGLTKLVEAVRQKFTSSSSSSNPGSTSGRDLATQLPASSSAAPLQQGQHHQHEAAGGSASAGAAAGITSPAQTPGSSGSSSVFALKRLYCSWNALGGDAGLQVVAELFADSLEELAVNSSSSVGDAGLIRLAACKQLQRLDLSKTGVTDEGLKALLQELPDLQQVEISGCRGVDRLARGAAARSVAALKEFWHI